MISCCRCKNISLYKNHFTIFFFFFRSSLRHRTSSSLPTPTKPTRSRPRRSSTDYVSWSSLCRARRSYGHRRPCGSSDRVRSTTTSISYRSASTSRHHPSLPCHDHEWNVRADDYLDESTWTTRPWNYAEKAQRRFASLSHSPFWIDIQSDALW